MPRVPAAGNPGLINFSVAPAATVAQGSRYGHAPTRRAPENPDLVTDRLVWRPAEVDHEIVLDLHALFDEICDDTD